MLKQMTSVGLCLTSLISCNYQRAPKVELCIVGRSGCICKDFRTGEQYNLEFIQCENYLATNPDDYKALKNFALDVAMDLEECKSREKTGKTILGDL